MSQVVAFDFDNTLTVEEFGKPTGWNDRMIRRLKIHALDGDVVIIVTARHGQEEDEHLSALGWERVGEWPLVYATIRKLNLPVSAVFFTNGEPKGPYLVELGVTRLYDDDIDQRISAVEHGVEAVIPFYP